jgi:hypothetical protein
MSSSFPKRDCSNAAGGRVCVREHASVMARGWKRATATSLELLNDLGIVAICFHIRFTRFGHIGIGGAILSKK